MSRGECLAVDGAGLECAGGWRGAGTMIGTGSTRLIPMASFFIGTHTVTFLDLSSIKLLEAELRYIAGSITIFKPIEAPICILV